MVKSFSSESNFQFARWAEFEGKGHFGITPGPKKIAMCNSDGTGEPLVKEDFFGADIIRFPAGGGVGSHVHEGAHILFVLKGTGRVISNSGTQNLEPGLCYLVPSMTPHAIEADEELILIAVGNDHRDLNSTDRMQPL